MFRALVSDPPWFFDDQGSRLTPKYGLMSNADIEALGPSLPAADDSLLFLWCPSAILDVGLSVMRAWSFETKTTIVWVKVCNGDAEKEIEDARPRIGGGHYVRCAHEIVLVGARGKASQLIRDHSIPSWFAAPRGVHSAKPERLQDMIESLITGPYLEMFARRARPGWTCLGDELPGGGIAA